MGPPGRFKLGWGALLGWLAIAVVYIGTRWQAIATQSFSDIDDQLRLVQVRDLAAGQGWFDLHQYRIDPASGGTLMHWSRLVDLPLLQVYRLLAPLLGPELAERVMLVAVPMLLLGLALFLLARLVRTLFDLELAALACVLLALSPPFATQFQPLRIDHHGWQIIAVLAACNGLIAHRAALGAALAGAALALGLSISLELLPIAALFGTVFALRWIEDRRDSAPLTSYAAALALVGGLSFALTRGAADLAAHCDAVSPPYLAGFVVLAAAIALLHRLAPQRLPVLLGGFAATGLVAIASTIALAPDCARGPFQALDPLVREYWYLNVYEGRPVWLQLPGAMLQMVVPPALGLWAAIKLWRRDNGPQRRFWRDYALLLGGLLVMGVLIARSAAFAVAVGIVPLAWLLREWLRRAVATKSVPKKTGLVLAALAALLPGMFAVLPGKVIPALASQRASTSPLSACDVRSAARDLAALPRGTFLTPLDVGPSLLLSTQHSVIATGHHRAAAAMHDTIAAFLAEPEAARRIMAAREAQYVLLCPGLAEAGNYAAAAPDGLAAKLLSGDTPGWLAPVALSGTSGVKAWRVVPQAATNFIASPFMQ